MLSERLKLAPAGMYDKTAGVWLTVGSTDWNTSLYMAQSKIKDGLIFRHGCNMTVTQYLPSGHVIIVYFKPTERTDIPANSVAGSEQIGSEPTCSQCE